MADGGAGRNARLSPRQRPATGLPRSGIMNRPALVDLRGVGTVADKLASLTSWRLAAALVALGAASYGAISLALWLLTTLQPLVSIACALVAVGWTWRAVQRVRKWRPSDWRSRGLVERE